MTKTVAKIKDNPKDNKNNCKIGIIINILDKEGNPLINKKKIRNIIKFRVNERSDTRQALITKTSDLKFNFLTISLLETIELSPSTVLSEKKFHKIIPNNKNNE